MIAGGVAKKALAGDMAASFFWLKCKAGWREKDRFAEQQQVGSISFGWVDDPEVIAKRAGKKAKNASSDTGAGDGQADQVQPVTVPGQVSQLPN